MTRVLRLLLLLLWTVFGLSLILVPWTNFWDANYFLYQYPSLGLVLRNAYLRGAVSGLGFMNVLLSLEAFRHRTSSVAKRS
ncbi:MAG TPA: hypothetical protein VEJ38_01725 [Candidatus Acidoferrales bacterium]|nr:hypothetical protein [Candidatus Acidoferrales bacterium]